MGISAATIAVCLAGWGLHPDRSDAEETVDLIEINHFHDDQGRPVFDQILFYDWSPAQGRYQLRDWRLLKSQNQIPLASARDREFVAVWTDPKTRDTLRATKAKIVRETWTHFDPELVEREYLAENLRRKLKDVPAIRQNVSAEQTGQEVTARRPLRPLQSPAR
jgi:hypothetical protein